MSFREPHFEAAHSAIDKVPVVRPWHLIKKGNLLFHLRNSNGKRRQQGKWRYRTKTRGFLLRSIKLRLAQRILSRLEGDGDKTRLRSNRARSFDWFPSPRKRRFEHHKWREDSNIIRVNTNIRSGRVDGRWFRARPETFNRATNIKTSSRTPPADWGLIARSTCFHSLNYPDLSPAQKHSCASLPCPVPDWI